ncbi:hypothetical protein PKB_2058 [Pseudomonas knackmussii B13]|uniref:DUF3289 family protein n=1 Tax=Pseudomonas knackmussii (strain DSM 6978 / CCUG 54928 / LMG 23759 / B13) TaxID=1301098 RepID=A0A024HEB6_PSEKB|nr:PAAR domain-containing protein [Pseudomonas knackmussii]CDF83405.1 hypothetical protein PKB_2058 [Pseudomonas knackmussii B13]
MSYRANVHGRGQGLHGDKTTTGAICLGSLPEARHAGRGILRQGDRTTPCPQCGHPGVIVEGEPQMRFDQLPVALDGMLVRCGCPAGSNRLIAPLREWIGPGEPPSAKAAQLSAATAPQKAPISPLANPAAASSGNAAASCPVPPKPPAPEPLRLPARIFLSQGKMDDYAAPDMKHGDLDAKELKRRYDWAPNYISEIAEPSRLKRWLNSFKVDTLTREEQRKADAQELFEEFHRFAKPFSWYGPYRSLIDRLIDHMQGNTGAPFRHPLMDQALKEHESMAQSLKKIEDALRDGIDWKRGYYPADMKKLLVDAVLDSRLPKFDGWVNRIDGMGLAVHDTAATEITLKSLNVDGNHFRAEVNYRVQDHFGLDEKDISHSLYGSLPLFQIWFVLQRWSGYDYKPFITEMHVTTIIEDAR